MHPCYSQFPLHSGNSRRQAALQTSPITHRRIPNKPNVQPINHRPLAGIELGFLPIKPDHHPRFRVTQICAPQSFPPGASYNTYNNSASTWHWSFPTPLPQCQRQTGPAMNWGPLDPQPTGSEDVFTLYLLESHDFHCFENCLEDA